MFSNNLSSAVKQFYLKEDLLHTKIAVLIAICFCLFFIRNDYIFFGTSPLFYHAVLVRFIFVLISLGTLFYFRRTKTYQQLERITHLWCSFFILLCAYINITRQEDNINFTYLDTVVVLLISIYLPGRVWRKGLLAGTLTASDLTILFFFKTQNYTASLEVIFFSYFLALLLGLVISAKIHKFRHEQYYALVKEHNMRVELEQLAYTDYLTGALNRRKFFELGDHQYTLFVENSATFSVIMLDLDFFKNLNDEFGHAAGDIFLKTLTKLIIDHKRSNDLLGRLGGEEFALILPETKMKFAIQMAERLRSLCENHKALFNKKTIHTTVSIGVTEVWKKDSSFHDVLKRADEALYLAKRQGRNRVNLIVKKA